jgi:Protein of unknown function (DUF1348)
VVVPNLCIRPARGGLQDVAPSCHAYTIKEAGDGHLIHEPSANTRDAFWLCATTTAAMSHDQCRRHHATFPAGRHKPGVIRTGNTVSSSAVPSGWRNRDEFITGREQTVEPLTGNRAREPDYVLRKSRWATPVVISHRGVAQRKGKSLLPLRDH